ncbi:hypothetical protein MBLNU459_g6221t1 [Dothideomycetes sp. NU459]
MVSLLLSVFLLNVLIHLVNAFGAATINELLWLLYNKLPTPTAKDAQEAARMRREVVRLKREMNAVSAQDEFSRWAKLRRQHDKAVAEHEKSASSVQATKATFDKVANAVRWLSTNGLRYLLQFWFSKQALFWLPQGWVPSYVEWILAFPRAPRGSISIQVWGIACASVTAMVSEAILALYKLTLQTSPANKQREEPMAFGSSTGASAPVEKKEL